MADERLLGMWSDKYLYQGSMQATDIAFAADGTGWIFWSNFGGGFELTRFRWQAAAGGDLTLHTHEYVGGRWRRAGNARALQVREQHAEDEQIAVAYQITEGQDVLGNPATLLEFKRELILGVTGRRFAFERKLAADEHDPAVCPLSGRAADGLAVVSGQRE